MGIFFFYSQMLQSHLVLLMTSVDVPILHKAMLYFFCFVLVFLQTIAKMFVKKNKIIKKNLILKKKNVTVF